MPCPCPFSKYRDALGEPKKGVHSLRVLNTPVVDYLLSILLAGFVTFLTDIPLVLTTIIVFIISIVLHIMFGVETTVTNYFGIKCKS